MSYISEKSKTAVAKVFNILSACQTADDCGLHSYIWGFNTIYTSSKQKGSVANMWSDCLARQGLPKLNV